eukprot:IDg22247t1
MCRDGCASTTIAAVLRCTQTLNYGGSLYDIFPEKRHAFISSVLQTPLSFFTYAITHLSSSSQMHPPAPTTTPRNVSPLPARNAVNADEAEDVLDLMGQNSLRCESTPTAPAGYIQPLRPLPLYPIDNTAGVRQSTPIANPIRPSSVPPGNNPFSSTIDVSAGPSNASAPQLRAGPPRGSTGVRRNATRGRGRGNATRGTGFTQREVDNLLSTIETHLPLCSQEWDIVEKMPTGDPRMPDDVRWAKRIRHAMAERADLGDGTEGEQTIRDFTTVSEDPAAPSQTLSTMRSSGTMTGATVLPASPERHEEQNVHRTRSSTPTPRPACGPKKLHNAFKLRHRCISRYV